MPVRQFSIAPTQKYGILCGAFAAGPLSIGRGSDSRLPEQLVKTIDLFEAGGKWLIAGAVLRGLAAHWVLSTDHPLAAVGWLDPVAEITWRRAFAGPLMVTHEGDYIEALARVGRTERRLTA